MLSGFNRSFFFLRWCAQQGLSRAFWLSHRRFFVSAEESNEKSNGKQLTPSDQHKVSIRKPFKKRPVL
jgi:hypothetical protein